MKKFLQLFYVYEFWCDSELLKSALDSISSLEWIENGKRNFTSKNQNFLELSTQSKLKIWILSCINDVNTNFTFERVRITQSWVNKNPPECYHHQHTHGNSLWSGVLFLTNNASNIHFCLKNNWCPTGIIEVTPIDNLDYEVVHREKSEKGKLIIFPSSLPHRVEKNTDSFDRYTLAFNTFPIGKIGTYDRSNEVII